MMNILNNPIMEYLSLDSICEASLSIHDDDILYPTEFLNHLKFMGISNLILHFTKWVLVMLLRNLNQSNGLCNGTRM